MGLLSGEGIIKGEEQRKHNEGGGTMELNSESVRVKDAE